MWYALFKTAPHHGNPEALWMFTADWSQDHMCAENDGNDLHIYYQGDCVAGDSIYANAWVTARWPPIG
jgi:hypothetical protein